MRQRNYNYKVIRGVGILNRVEKFYYQLGLERIIIYINKIEASISSKKIEKEYSSL